MKQETKEMKVLKISKMGILLAFKTIKINQSQFIKYPKYEQHKM